MELTYDKCVILDQDELLNTETLHKLKDIPHEYFTTVITADLKNIVDKKTIVIQPGKDNTSKVERFQSLKMMFPGVLILPLYDSVDMEMAVNILSAKVYDPTAREGFLLLLTCISNAITKPSLAKHNDHEFVLGLDPQMRTIYHDIQLVANTDYSVILYGETGTGKESLAKMIHNQSKRKAGPFITVDCGCLHREIAASELFGHVKGAFTDAFKDKTGAFEMADGGTLFLDEIANMPYDVQISLLRALQEHNIRKIGSAVEKRVDVRIVAATNEDLSLLVAQKEFRQDLYYRLNEMTVYLPPLRERPGDIALLTDAFIKSISKSAGKDITGITEEAMELIKTYSWPGNIRELKNVLKRACLLTPDGTAITAEALSLSTGIAEDTFQDSREQDLRGAASLAERERIFDALRKADYNKKKAAALLNIHRKTLYNKLKALEYDKR
jgi:two-component system response regulator HydG